MALWRKLTSHSPSRTVSAPGGCPVCLPSQLFHRFVYLLRLLGREATPTGSTSETTPASWPGLQAAGRHSRARVAASCAHWPPCAAPLSKQSGCAGAGSPTSDPTCKLVFLQLPDEHPFQGALCQVLRAAQCPVDSAPSAEPDAEYPGPDAGDSGCCGFLDSRRHGQLTAGRPARGRKRERKTCCE